MWEIKNSYRFNKIDEVYGAATLSPTDILLINALETMAILFHHTKQKCVTRSQI
jgi:hypothetical protein